MAEKKETEVKEETEKPTEPMTTIPTKQLQGILDNFETIQREHKMLLETADKTRVAKYQAQNKEKVNRRCNLRSWTVEVGKEGEKRNEDKVIVGWEMIKDRGSEYNIASDKWTEVQEIRIYLEDKTKLEVPYAVFGKRYVLLGGEILSETKKTVEGKDTIEYTVKANNGKEYQIPGYAIN